MDPAAAVNIAAACQVPVGHGQGRTEMRQTKTRTNQDWSLENINDIPPPQNMAGTCLDTGSYLYFSTQDVLLSHFLAGQFTENQNPEDNWATISLT